MIEWLDEFYGDPEFQSEVESAFLPLFTSYAASVVESPSKAFIASLVASFVARYLDSSRAQLQEVLKGTDEPMAALTERFAEWTEKRPGKVAANETVRSANALAVDQMRSEGVVTKVWSSGGSNTCPYCTSLDGTAVEIERDFFTPSDSFQPEGAESPLTFTTTIGAPPVHAGCVCSVVPG